MGHVLPRTRKRGLLSLFGHICRSVRFLLPAVLVLCASDGWSQQSAENVKIDARINVHFDQPDGTISPIWNYFGYDEPNYTYARNGQKLLGELAKIDASPVYVRTHNLFTTGDGSASLKWGSTNVYTEDAEGKPVYSWTIIDRIFDTYHAAGITPLVELGFMPEALSTHPQPYRHEFPNIKVGDIYTGWAYPPKDYKKWSELVFQFTKHLRERYGDAEVKTWLWEVWNEPDIGYWKGTPEEYFQLYDYSVDAVLRAFPDAKIGGPDSTGPGSERAVNFLRSFLDHCAHQKNYATGKTGTRIDFISFHPKGAPTWKDDHVEMGISRQLGAIKQGFEIVASFPEWKNTPIILGESDPEGCAACSAKTNPQNLYRNGPLYGAYTVETMNNIFALAKQKHVNFRGAVTWAFEFEDQPPFAGFRELATNGFDKPVLNAFRMLGFLGSERVKVTSSESLPVDDIVLNGVRNKADVNAMATRKDHEVEILVWNYHDIDLPSSAAPVDLTITGLPANVSRALLEHFRVDATHSDAFTAWKELGSPATPSERDYQRIERAGQLQLLTSPAWMEVKQGNVELHFTLPRQGLSLIRLAW